MGHRRGQSTVEAIALAVLVGAALTATALAVRSGSAERAAALIAARLGAGPPPAPSPAALAFLERALAPDPRAPALHDAVGRLAAEVGAGRAHALAVDAVAVRHLPPAPTGRVEALADPSLALARPDLDGVGAPAEPGVWAEESPRAAPSIRIAGPEAERAWRAALDPGLAERAIDGAAATAASAFSSLNPAAAAAVMGTSALTAAGRDPEHGAPAGAREDDVLLCRPVWRVNRATPDWVRRHPHAAARLALGRRHPAVELVVVRAGHVIQRALVRSDATRC